MTDKKSTVSDLDKLYELVTDQFSEDRQAAKDAYDKLKEEILKEPSLFLESGDTLAKYCELMIKQTAQVVDLVKVASKNQVKNEALTEGDLDSIQDEIDSGKNNES